MRKHVKNCNYRGGGGGVGQTPPPPPPPNALRKSPVI